ncbi:MAG: DNA topoisomerase I [Chloroflexi bacterium]|nr:DNA topoisomerase I [Chloroflexota bacterium]
MANPSKRDLVIVESPAKARTVGRFLGDEYIVKASMGHVRDLPKNDLGVDVENLTFEPTYVNVRGRASLISEIKKAAKQADSIYLATDPDREGEAISWHLVEAADLARSGNLKRVVFHEITNDAIEEAFSHPRDIDMELVNAQQARRLLDRIVGYRLSPVLWSKVKRGLSAGRVQSVALRIIVDREREIEAFKPKEYWVITVDLETKTEEKKFNLTANLTSVPDQKGKPVVDNETTALEIKKDLDAGRYSVSKVTSREVKQRPRPPFTTSTLQQQAARSFRFNAQRTMRIAQDLYEGIELGSAEPVGLITYMRTDSVNLAQNALDEAMTFIKSNYGDEYTNGPKRYHTRSKAAQEAHEAIRPTSVDYTPEKVAKFLSQEQLRLYTMIWKRTLASQMADAIVDNTGVDITAKTENGSEYIVRATGSVIKFDGYRRLYIETKDEDAEDENSNQLPPLNDGNNLTKVKVDADQKFTQPPPRYTEANLIRFLEEQGIGRPSTYASIVGTIERRYYVDRQKSRFKPTPMGVAVSDFLSNYFANIMDTGFTSDMEAKLDSVAEGEQDWVEMLKEFFAPFDQAVTETANKAERVDRRSLLQMSEEKCDGGDLLVIRNGRYGKFLSCGRFPECRVAISERPGERATGEVKENWEIAWKAAMEKCAILHPEAAAKVAQEAEAKQSASRKRRKKKPSTGATVNN